MAASIIKNMDYLLKNGCIEMRRDSLDIISCGIASVIPFNATLNLIRIEEDEIVVGNNRFPAGKENNIYVVGAGKGSFPIAQALDKLLGSRIKKGIVIVKEGETRTLDNIEVYQSSHPLPDERSVVSARKIIDILSMAGENDLVFAAITGGSSAMVNMPADGITINELKEANELLLKSGADIAKINTVRKHLCMIKGGRLVQFAQPANVITLTLDTAPQGMPWPDMCLPDPTTFSDAIRILKDYSLWDKVASSIRQRLIAGTDNPDMETLKSLNGMNHVLFSLAEPSTACITAAERAYELGYYPYIISTTLEGEAKDVGVFLAGITNEVLQYNRPFSPPCALISGGETTVSINDRYGEGGPNQETALAFATKLLDLGNVVFVSVDTDGTDGPSGVAGGIVDSHTGKYAKSLGINLDSVLKHHDSLNALRKLGSEIITGHTGTNVMNLRVVLIKR